MPKRSMSARKKPACSLGGWGEFGLRARAKARVGARVGQNELMNHNLVRKEGANVYCYRTCLRVSSCTCAGPPGLSDVVSCTPVGSRLSIMNGSSPPLMNPDSGIRRGSSASAMLRMATDGSRKLDSGLRDPKWCCEARSVILDLGRSGEKSRLSSFELKSHLLSASARTRDSGSRI